MTLEPNTWTPLDYANIEANNAWLHAEKAHNDPNTTWPNDAMVVDYLRAIAAELRAARIARSEETA